MGPLQGIKVIDMTTVLMGPYATQTLGDYGADIIKVGVSSTGDVTRLIGPTRHPPGMGRCSSTPIAASARSASTSRRPPPRTPCCGLPRPADVLIYNVRPQAMARLDLGYEAVAARQSAPGLCRRVRLRPGRALMRRNPPMTILIQARPAIRFPAADGADQRRHSALCAERAGRPHRGG